MDSHTNEARRYRSPLPAMVLVGFLAIYIRLWIGLLELPALGGSDFISFYTAGRIARSGAYQLMYDLPTHYAIQSSIVGPNFVPGGVIMSQHPPFLAPLLGLIASDDYRAAYIAWSVILLVIFGLSAFITARFLGHQGFDSFSCALLSIDVALFYPAFISLYKGQDTAFVLLGALGWMYGMITRRERLAGVALALTLLKPQIALALALPLLASRSRAAWWFCGTATLLALYSWLLVGSGGLIDLVGLMRLSADGWGYGTNQPAMFNFLGLLVRSAPWLDPITLSDLKWGFYILSIVFLCWLWWGRRETLGYQLIGIGIILAVFASPHLHMHDLSLLVLPAVGLVLWLWNRGDRGRVLALAILPASSLLLIAGDLIPNSLHYVPGYGLMLALGIGLVVTMRASRHRPPGADAVGTSASGTVAP